ncbi:MAG: MFS transporter [Candidatus Acetothermia bacterium]|jgi:MFS family permease|nr:MFS transporter [Candidatus Acetothermia bacterium]MDH7505155.1 MFS transporter [Candidatus Acetothermia bacterium]
MRRTERWFLAFTCAFIAAGSASLLLPLFAATALGGTVGQIGLMASVASLAGVPFSIIWGRLSDRLGRRKPFILLAFLGSGGALFLMSLSRGMTYLILLNALMNAFWVASAAVSTILAIEGVAREHWESRIGWFNRYTGAGWVSGLALGSVWSRLASGLPDGGLRALFYPLAALDLAAAVMVLRLIRERGGPVEARGFPGVAVVMGNMLIERFRYAPFHLYYLARPKRLLELFRGENRFGRKLTRYYRAVVLIFMGLSAFFVPLPIFFREALGMDNAVIYALWMVHSGTSTLVHRQAGRLAERLGNWRVQWLALAVRMAIFPLAALLALAPPALRIPAIVTFFLFTGTTWAMTNVTSISITAKLAPEEAQGQALGVYNALIGVGWILGSLIGGYVASWLGYLACFSVASAFVLLALISLRRLRLREGTELAPAERNGRSATIQPSSPRR